jgi:hypothetical protein
MHMRLLTAFFHEFSPEFSIERNNIGDHGAEAIAAALRVNRSLTVLQCVNVWVAHTHTHTHTHTHARTQ